MPKVRIGDKLHPIEWDADKVADLIFQGYEVETDHGIDPATYEFHKQEIESRLREKWKDTNFRAGSPQEARRTAPTLPSIRVGEDPLRSYPGGGASLDVLPNPYKIYTGNQIDRGVMQDIQNMLNFSRNIKKPVDL